MSVDPGEGYRLLRDGEIIQKGDEYSYDEKTWRPLGLSDFGLNFDAENDYPCRRKLRGKTIHLYTTRNDLGVIIGATVYASELPIPFENVVEIKSDPSTGTLYVEDGHGRPTGEA